MQAIMESIFDVVYLITVITLGIIMIRHAKGNATVKLFGIMAVVLGCGDAFHLVPRVYSQLTDGFAAHAMELGVGRFVTSITMTIFYVILYHIWRMSYDIKGRKGLTILLYVLAGLRVVLCFFPQNEWLSAHPPLSWGIYRNIPFALMGIIILVLFFIEARKTNDSTFKFMWLAIALSFLFYAPVVLWADTVPLVGLLMIPKTCAYVWIVLMGYMGMKKNKL